MPAHIVDLNDFNPEHWPSTPDGEARQAEQIVEFYERLYKCPLVEAFTYWSYSDGSWLNAPAGLMTKDARVKPSYDALYDLIMNKWRTPELMVKSDENGYVEVTGFRGKYEAIFEGGSLEFEI